MRVGKFKRYKKVDPNSSVFQAGTVTDSQFPSAQGNVTADGRTPDGPVIDFKGEKYSLSPQFESNPNGDQMLEQLKKMMPGKKFNVVRDASGRILSLTGGDLPEGIEAKDLDGPTDS